MINKIMDLAKKYEDELIEARRYLHRIPEIGLELPKTINYVCEKLKSYGVEYELKGNGVVAQINGKTFGKTIAFRADMDALNIIEQTDSEYKSLHEGKMHACGHDGHIAICLITARILNEIKDNIQGSIRLIFQAGEETGNGAKSMLAENILDNVDAIYALHIGNLGGDGYKTGSFTLLNGPTSAGKDKFLLEVIGKSAHGAFPQKGIDPIIASAHIITNLRKIYEEEHLKGKALVITVGSINAGIDHNSIPDKAILKGSIRTQDEDVRGYVVNRVKAVAEETAKEFGAQCIVNMTKGSNPIINDKKMFEMAADALQQAFSEDEINTVSTEWLMGSDDFANYASKVPGLYYYLNTNNPDKGMDKPNHNSQFDLDETVLWKGVAGNIVIAMKYLNGEEA